MQKRHIERALNSNSNIAGTSNFWVCLVFFQKLKDTLQKHDACVYTRNPGYLKRFHVFSFTPTPYKDASNGYCYCPNKASSVQIRVSEIISIHTITPESTHHMTGYARAGINRKQLVYSGAGCLVEDC